MEKPDLSVDVEERMIMILMDVQPSNVKDEDIDGTAMEDVDGVPLEEIDGTPLDGDPIKDTADDDINGVPLKSIVPYGDDIDGEPGISEANYSFICCLLYPLPLHK